MHLDDALKSLESDESKATPTAKGPRGGDVDRPQGSDARRADFSPISLGTDGLGLHRFRDTAVPGLQKEQAWHRMAAYMMLQGMSNIDIARAAGKDKVTISTLRAQAWFQQLLSTLANEHGIDQLQLLKGEVVQSIQTLVSLRDSSDDAAVRLRAATTIIEQAHGKPIQRIHQVVQNRPYASANEEATEIQRELEAIRAAKATNHGEAVERKTSSPAPPTVDV